MHTSSFKFLNVFIIGALECLSADCIILIISVLVSVDYFFFEYGYIFLFLFMSNEFWLDSEHYEECIVKTGFFYILLKSRFCSRRQLTLAGFSLSHSGTTVVGCSWNFRPAFSCWGFFGLFLPELCCLLLGLRNLVVSHVLWLILSLNLGAYVLCSLFSYDSPCNFLMSLPDWTLIFAISSK